jgi:hypothetical protein
MGIDSLQTWHIRADLVVDIDSCFVVSHMHALTGGHLCELHEFFSLPTGKLLDSQCSEYLEYCM